MQNTTRKAQVNKGNKALNAFRPILWYKPLWKDIHEGNTVLLERRGDYPMFGLTR